VRHGYVCVETEKLLSRTIGSRLASTAALDTYLCIYVQHCLFPVVLLPLPLITYVLLLHDAGREREEAGRVKVPRKLEPCGVGRLCTACWRAETRRGEGRASRRRNSSSSALSAPRASVVRRRVLGGLGKPGGIICKPEVARQSPAVLRRKTRRL
jgi:hypothetical protein